jgi:hypothetical protein
MFRNAIRAGETGAGRRERRGTLLQPAERLRHIARSRRVGHQHQSQDEVVSFDVVGNPDEIGPPEELPGGTMAGRGKREAVQLPRIERQRKTEVDGGGFGPSLIQKPRTARGEDVRHADFQRTPAPQVPIAAIQDDGQALLGHVQPSTFCSLLTD